MKELSIEEKAKRYDEAIERAKYYQKENGSAVISAIFPELKESEDEKPNGAIVMEDFNEGNGFYKVNLAYLNKEQVEDIENIIKRWNAQKYDEEAIRDCIGVILTDASEQRFVDFNTSLKDCLAWLEKQGEHANFLSKIQVGDKVTRNEDGVLVNLSQLKRVAKPAEEQGEQKQELLTKEKALKNSPFVEQKSAEWSEEDEKEVAVLEAYIRSKDWSGRHIDRALGIVDELVNKVKSLRPQPKQEWSEEDEKTLEYAIDIIEWYSVVDKSKSRRVSDWLKSLKERYTWKPSDEQMKALDFAADCIVPDEFCFKRKALKELYKDLKKLREE